MEENWLKTIRNVLKVESDSLDPSYVCVVISKYLKQCPMKVETFLGTVSTGTPYLAANAEVTHLVDTAWNFAYSCLWNMTILSAKEIKASKERIHEILTTTKRPRRRFVAFCQRVLLARQRLSTATGLDLPLPSLWLDKEDDDGFEMTRSWLQEINSIRESLPYYEHEIKVMAEAILQFSDTPSAQNYRYWSEYFIERQNSQLLILFQVTAAQQLYS